MKKRKKPVSGSQPGEGYKNATSKNLHLDSQSGGIETQQKDRIFTYLNAMGLVEVKDIQTEEMLKEYVSQVILALRGV